MAVAETERLRLREFTAADAAFVLELLNEPAWLEHIGDRGVRTVDDARRYIDDGPRAMYARHGFGIWLVENKADGEPVGACGLLKREVLQEVDLGFAFLERHWGNGFAREAATAALRLAHERWGLSRLVALTARRNERSMTLLRRLGFRFLHVRAAEGTLAESNVFLRELP